MTVAPLAFEIAHCSSWDEDYYPEQLIVFSPGNHEDHATEDFTKKSDTTAPTNGDTASPKVKGWQTIKCPTYPQDLIIRLLQGPVHITKVQILSHHYKIATKIDIYIGLVKDDLSVPEDLVEVPVPSEEMDDDMVIEFTRLGYVCLDDNSRAEYKVRELKSIKVDADGEYIRLVIRGCHHNALNVHEQAGILALNIQGAPLLDSSCTRPDQSLEIRYPDDPGLLFSPSSTRSSTSTLSFVSTNDVDFELQQWIGPLTRAEEQAAKDEAYGLAKLYKETSEELSKMSGQLDDLEMDKKRAVESKEYDQAEKIKANMYDIKCMADKLLKESGIQVSPDGQIITPNTSEVEQNSNLQCRHETVVLPLQESLQPEPIREESTLPVGSISCKQNTTRSKTLSAAVSKKHSLRGSGVDSLLPAKPATKAPSPTQSKLLTDSERESYALPIRVFGEPIVANMLSVKAKCREDALVQIADTVKSACLFTMTEQLDQVPELMVDSTVSADDMGMDNEKYGFTTRQLSLFIRASLVMLQDAIMDSRDRIIQITIAIWRDVNDLCDTIPPELIFSMVERAFIGLLMRTHDANVRIAQATTELVMELAQKYHTAPYTLIPRFIAKPDRVFHTLKDSLARVHLVASSVKGLCVQSTPDQHGIIPLDNVMAFAVAYSGHTQAEVRKATVELLVDVIEQVGFASVSKYIDSKELKKSLAQTVKEFAVSRKKHGAASKKTARAGRSVNGTKTSPTAVVAKKDPRNSSASRAPIADSKKVCIFCEEQNQNFNEDTLVTHYYDECPALTSCPQCQTILEISTLQEHIFSDCSKRHLVKECTRCRQGIPVEQWLQHIRKQTCKAVRIEDKCCPLCLTTIQPATEDQWKIHLLKGDGCPKNPRAKGGRTKTRVRLGKGSSMVLRGGK